MRKKTGSKRLKLKVYTFLETTHNVWSRVYNYVVTLLVMASLVVAILATIGQLKHRAIFVLERTLEIVLLLIFVVELFLRVWSSTAHGTYGASGGLKRYLLKPHIIIDGVVVVSSIVIITAFYLNVNRQNERVIHVLQVLRVLRLDRQRGAFVAFTKVFRRHRNELLTCWYMGFIMISFVSFLVYAMEEKKEAAEDTLFNSVYWGVISLTTIGYGDISPESAQGKIVTCCFAMFGALFLAMPAGIIGSGFALQVAEQQKIKHVNSKRRPAAELLQSCWRKFAADNDLEATWKPHIKGRKDHYTQMKRDTRSTNSLVSYSSLKQHNFDKDDKDALWYPRERLNLPEKNALRFVRFLKCILSRRRFREAIRPYDERDILASFTSSQVEMFAKLKELRIGMNNIQKVQDMDQNVKSLRKEISEIRVELNRTNCLLRDVLNSKRALDNSSSDEDQQTIFEDASDKRANVCFF